MVRSSHQKNVDDECEQGQFASRGGWMEIGSRFQRSFGHGCSSPEVPHGKKAIHGKKAHHTKKVT